MSLAAWIGIEHSGLAMVVTAAAHMLIVVLAVLLLTGRRKNAGWRSRWWVGALATVLLTAPVVLVLEASEARLVALEVEAAVTHVVEPAPAFETALDPGPTSSAPVVEAVRSGSPPPATPIMPKETSWSYVESVQGRDADADADALFGLLMACWILGSWIAAARLLRLRRLVRRLRADASPLEDAKLTAELQVRFPGTRLPSLASSRTLESAMTLGGGEALVVVPTEWTDMLTPSELADVLTHECAHVFHQDLRLGRFQSLSWVLFWWHPAVALLNRELSIAREELCDDEVLRVSTAARYARTLLALGEHGRAQPVASSAGRALLPRHWSLVDRVQGLIARDGARPPSREGSGWLALGLIVLTTFGAGLRIVNASLPEAAEGDHHISGVVIDAEGAGVPGAEILMAYQTSMTVHTRTGNDGSFAFMVRHDDPHFARHARVIARAHGLGVAWERVDAGASGGMRLTLPAGSAINGRIMNLEGEPVGGVRVQACELRESPGQSLEGWLRVLGGARETTSGIRPTFQELVYSRLRKALPLVAKGQALLSARTDADGRFRIEGAGRHRLVRLRIEGAGLATTDLMVVGSGISSAMIVPTDMNSPGEGRVQLFGPRFEHYAIPSRLIRGRVVDHVTDAPVPGITVRSEAATLMVTPYSHAAAPWVGAVTDSKGRFSLDGLAKDGNRRLTATPPDGSTYLSESVTLDDPEGVKPMDVEIRMERGVAIIGQVRAKGTRRGVAARVSWSRGPFFFGTFISKKCQDDGYFRMIVPPGEGRLTVCTKDSIGFALVSERDDIARKGDLSAVLMGSVHAVRRVEIDAAGNEPFNLDVVRRLVRVVRLLDADGKPLRNVAVCPPWSKWRAERTHEELRYADPKTEFLFHHEDRDLAGHFSAGPGDVKEIRLQPAARISGRIVTAAGKPVPRARVRLNAKGTHGTFLSAAPQGDVPDPVRADDAGRFAIGGLAAGVPYTLELIVVDPVTERLESVQDLVEGVTLSAGQHRDLGGIERKGDR